MWQNMYENNKIGQKKKKKLFGQEHRLRKMEINLLFILLLADLIEGCRIISQLASLGICANKRSNTAVPPALTFCLDLLLLS